MRHPACWGHRPAVMGVINITPDSFSDGGRFNRADLALNEASRQIRDGAQVLDLGAQSTRPGAVDVGAEEELSRLLPCLESIRAAHPQVILSVDTFLASVARAALQAGADWINDVSGGRRDPAMLPLVADAGCPYVLMHSRGDSQTMDNCTDYGDQGVVAGVLQELRLSTDRALQAGLSRAQLIWDPGLGFAKTTEQNLMLIRHLEDLQQDGIPLLLGPSRKRFIGAVLDQPRAKARIWGTAAVCARAVEAGIHVVRVHDVGPISQVVTMAAAVARQGS
ncbi:Dihydropteroate synthase [Synechococcus sp. MIT S9509]|uniref:dihydropteroate synthase n=1 Tax=unclassified Synechococcus TaxID=2626047 RepID=UPI0007BB6BDD|nr:MULTISPECIES: dihydropteroate synthase [unclassified Synechococcus]KZR87785.1 Dihydropteroate synthase [Synechococcus sp. MIT S9504]KZR93290.1 Dihydropteroate synthase [Synechococcus sp. MIT S9509]